MKFLFFDEIESTNAFMSQMIAQGDNICDLVVSTDFQTQGKGQGTNVWLSERGANLLFSIGLEVGFIKAADQFGLSQAVSVGIVEALLKHLPAEELAIKWPNDIYYGDCKMVGILISNTLDGDMMCKSVVGVGINVNQTSFDASLPNPVSMAVVSGHEHDRTAILNDVACSVVRVVGMLATPQGRNAVNDRYVSLSYRFGKWARYEFDGHMHELMIVGFSQWGMLQTVDRTGQKMEFDLKQIKFV